MEKFEPRELEALMIPEAVLDGVKPKQASFLS
jgi:hypothetical protein